LGLGKNNELGLYQFDCAKSSEFKKLKVLGTGVEDFDYFTVAVDGSKGIYQSVVLMTHGKPASKDGMSYSIIDYNNPDKATTLTMEIGPLTDNLKETSFSSLIRVHHNPTTNQLDIVFDGTDLTFTNIQTTLSLSSSKLAFTNTVAHKYWKPYPSLDLDCQTTKDFIICAMNTYTTITDHPNGQKQTVQASTKSSSIIYYPKFGSKTHFNATGYAVYTDDLARRQRPSQETYFSSRQLQPKITKRINYFFGEGKLLRIENQNTIQIFSRSTTLPIPKFTSNHSKSIRVGM
jgi:hypothetical protein